LLLSPDSPVEIAVNIMGEAAASAACDKAGSGS
jgi:hypothetical protein